MKTTTEEMETTINFCRNESEVSIWTSDTTMHTKLDKLCKTSPDYYKCTEIGRDRDGDLISKTYTITDKTLLSFRTGHSRRKLTDEERDILRERLASRIS